MPLKILATYKTFSLSLHVFINIFQDLHKALESISAMGRGEWMDFVMFTLSQRLTNLNFRI